MDDHGKGENEEGGWLELGLGFTRPTSSSSSSKGLGLGLGFGLGATPSNNYDPLAPPLTWFSASRPPPSSSSPWPWPMVSARGFLPDRQTPVTRSSTGLWFTLVTSMNSNGEVLPQVPKAYIRVREANVTILMVQKYLVAKLGLSNEAERRRRKGKENLESCTT